ncbi:hypothetical protein Acr_00g0012080 [Actinidia rufa]|uniref:Retrovirus-related Pol polyprotein from transposon TNT 1-94-like beta-barrel domain-containing protein n=1 Tax=Actinidia rufa TaxID=165716 RepID=A0A7J0D9T8_9ERIC|nr:hypothetical protein Acr_00g0012080 [Actinidia rufa]
MSPLSFTPKPYTYHESPPITTSSTYDHSATSPSQVTATSMLCLMHPPLPLPALLTCRMADLRIYDRGDGVKPAAVGRLGWEIRLPRKIYKTASEIPCPHQRAIPLFTEVNALPNRSECTCLHLFTELYNSSKSTLSPSSELLYGHPALVAPLLSEPDFLHVSQSISLRSCTTLAPLGIPVLALRAFVHLLLPLSILLSNITGPMSDISAPPVWTLPSSRYSPLVFLPLNISLFFLEILKIPPLAAMLQPIESSILMEIKFFRTLGICRTSVNVIDLLSAMRNQTIPFSTTLAENTSEFQNLVNQLASIHLHFDDEMQALTAFEFLLESCETLVVSLSNSAQDGKLTMSTFKDTLFNEEARKKGISRGIAQSIKHINQSSETTSVSASVMIDSDSDAFLVALVDGNSDWILDSGSAYHFCRDREMFSTYTICARLVRMANNTTNKVVGKGTVRFRLADGRSMTLIELREEFLRIFKGNKEMLRGKKTRGLYRLDGSVQEELAVRYRSQIKANRDSSVSNRNSKEVATRERRFVGVRQGSDLSRRSLLSAGQRLRLLPPHSGSLSHTHTELLENAFLTRLGRVFVTLLRKEAPIRGSWRDPPPICAIPASKGQTRAVQPVQDVHKEAQKKETKSILRSCTAPGMPPPKRVSFALDLISGGDLSSLCAQRRKDEATMTHKVTYFAAHHGGWCKAPR